MIRKRIICMVIAVIFLCGIAGTAQDKEVNWDDVRYIIHAGGVLESGVTGSNSIEALNRSAALGYKLIELDFSWTTDHELVCIHDWETRYGFLSSQGCLSLAEFNEVRGSTYGYTSLTLSTLIDWLKEHPDVRIVTDIKEDHVAGAALIAERCPELKKQFIIQIYSYDEYAAIRDLGFDQIILTVYQMSWNEKTDIAALVAFAEKNDLAGLTVPVEFAVREGYIEGLQQAGVPLFVHTINDAEEQRRLFGMGVTGIYTDIGGSKSNVFSDIDAKAWYYKGIDYTVQNGLLVGTGRTKFEPERPFTRAMFAALLHRLSKQEVSEGAGMPFKDVSEQTWYYNDVLWAYGNKVVSGYSEEVFAPEENITREQMCLMMANFAKFIGYEMPENCYENLIRGYLVHYDDEGKISDWAADAVRDCTAAGVVSGMGNGRFEPQGIATRAEVASMIRRFVRAMTVTIEEETKDEKKGTASYSYQDLFAAYGSRIDFLNEQGLVVKSKYVDDSGFERTVHYEYDRQGRCAVELYLYANQKSYKVNYVYDEEGILIGYIVTLSTGVADYSFVLNGENELIAVKEDFGDQVVWTMDKDGAEWFENITTVMFR
ncbi:MAG: hypothetical protein HFE77_08340 [Clostridiales bacterium]|nr:hypothetical protein [Clostridiales bacterium]